MSTRFNFENHPGYEKLKEAFRLSNKDFLNSIELAPEDDVCFSSRYEKKMVRLIKRQKLPYWKYVNTVGKKIAVFAIVFMMLFSLSMTIEAVREPVVRFVVSVFDKFSELFVDESEIKNAPDKIEEVYTFGVLPDEFEETLFTVSNDFVTSCWSSGELKIELFQYVLDGKFSLDIEDVDAVTVYYNNIEIRCLAKNNITHAIWRDNKYAFELMIYGEESLQIITQLINSITIKQNC